MGKKSAGAGVTSDEIRDGNAIDVSAEADASAEAAGEQAEPTSQEDAKELADINADVLAAGGEGARTDEEHQDRGKIAEASERLQATETYDPFTDPIIPSSAVAENVAVELRSETEDSPEGHSTTLEALRGAAREEEGEKK